MSLFYNNNIAYSEKQMQKQVVELLQRDGICHELQPSQRPDRTKWAGRVVPVIIREHHIPQINRRSDIIAYLTPRKIINIECKLTDARSAIKQAEDQIGDLEGDKEDIESERLDLETKVDDLEKQVYDLECHVKELEEETKCMN